MLTTWVLVAGLACAQGPAAIQPAPASATSKVSAVTVYRDQGQVTREVAVPEGEGTIELVVTPMPSSVVEGSLFGEGADGLQVLSTRLRSRAVQGDVRDQVRAKEDQIKRLRDESVRLQKEAAVQDQDLRYLEKLENFTGASLTAMTAKGQLDSEAVVSLSEFILDRRATKSKAEMDLRQKLEANTAATTFAERQLAEISQGSSREERDALIVVRKAKREPGIVRLGYLVSRATWRPQYRLRASADASKVTLETLAAVEQQTGEDWSDMVLTLSTSQPSLNSAPPDLLPLKMAGAAPDDTETGPVAMGDDDRSRAIAAELEKSIDLSFPNPTPLEDVIKYIRTATRGQAYPDGIPIFVDPAGLAESETSLASKVVVDLTRVPLKTSLALTLGQIGLSYGIVGGVLKIDAIDSEQWPHRDSEMLRDDTRGMAGMGGGLTADVAEAVEASGLNRVAAGDQARELRVEDGATPAAVIPAKETPSVTFRVAGRLDVPSRPEPQVLEVGRFELPAEPSFKAVPVLTARVYRQARLTNSGNRTLLPGEAAVYVGADFVGRMAMPLVAPGEPFLVGLGVDPQVQVTRRLIRKERTIQGGNQIFTYEFRIGLRNYRPGPVKVQLWDRLPKPREEAVGVNLVKTSTELSTDPLYLRTGRLDNLLRWDVEVPEGTVGEKAQYMTYEFRLEYARDLPAPRFLSGDLREAPIGGMGGGMGGMGGGMR